MYFVCVVEAGVWVSCDFLDFVDLVGKGGVFSW